MPHTPATPIQYSLKHVCLYILPTPPPPCAPSPRPQVTKEDIEAEKARLAAIDARPIKKVAQAKARKQKRLQVGAEGSQDILSGFKLVYLHCNAQAVCDRALPYQL